MKNKPIEKIITEAREKFFKHLSNGKGCANDQGAWFYPLDAFDEILRSAAEELIKSERERIVKLLKKIPRYAHWKTHGENRPSTACSACGFDDGFDDALTQALSAVLKEIEE